MSPSKKQNIKKKLDVVKFVLLTILLGLIFVLMANIILYHEKNAAKPLDLREKVDLKEELKGVFFPGN